MRKPSSLSPPNSVDATLALTMASRPDCGKFLLAAGQSPILSQPIAQHESACRGCHDGSCIVCRGRSLRFRRFGIAVSSSVEC